MYNKRRQRTCVNPFLHVWIRQKKISLLLRWFHQTAPDGLNPSSIPRSAGASFSSFSQSRLSLRAGAS
jgi:hypothetical protein